MATVELDFAPLPGHVRTARLIAVAVARRAGIDAGPPGAELPPDDEGPADLLTTGTIRLPDTATDASPEVLPSGYNLAVIAGLVEDVDVEAGDESSPGTRVTMRWPTTGDGTLPASGAPAPPTPPGSPAPPGA